MPKRSVPTRKTTQVSKLSHSEMATAVHNKHQHITNAVHKVLLDAGLKGVSVHSIRFSVDDRFVSGGGCNPPCGPDEDCVLDSSDGQVRWVCVPKPKP
jgi:hypothetical protein